MHKRGQCRRAVSVCPSVSPYVRPAVRHVRVCVKTGNRILKHFVTTSSHTVLAFPRRTLWQYSDGNRPNEGVECSWGRQKSRFSTNIWLYHGYDKDKAIVTMKRQQELVYAMYQMVPFPMSTE